MSKKKTILLVILAAVLGIAIGTGITLGVLHNRNTGTLEIIDDDSRERASHSGTCGNDLTWEISDHVLIITGTGDMYDYTESAPAPWLDYSEEFNVLFIDEGVTGIGDYAFYGLDMFEDVNLPDSLTRIGDYAFYNCSMPYGPAYYDDIVIGKNAFGDDSAEGSSGEED